MKRLNVLLEYTLPVHSLGMTRLSRSLRRMADNITFQIPQVSELGNNNTLVLNPSSSGAGCWIHLAGGVRGEA